MKPTLVFLATLISLQSMAAHGQAIGTGLQTVSVNGGTVEYEEHGNPNGEPVIVIHGARLASALSRLADEPALSDYRLLRIHRRGYAGSSELEYPIATDQHPRDVLSLMDELNIERAHVLGHSSGGAFAIRMAQIAPDAVHSLVLLDPSLPFSARPGFVEPDDIDAEVERMAAVARRQRQRTREDIWAVLENDVIDEVFGGREALESLIPGAYDLFAADALDDVHVERASSFANENAVRQMYSRQAAQDIIDLRQPIQMIYATNGAAEFLDVGRPGTEFILLDDADHWFPARNSEETANLIADFLRRNSL